MKKEIPKCKHDIREDTCALCLGYEQLCDAGLPGKTKTIIELTDIEFPTLFYEFSNNNEYEP